MNFICCNGNFLPADTPVLFANNRGFKYGDGLFETMKMIDGEIPLADLHFERLFLSIRMLEMKMARLNKEKLLQHIKDLCIKNQCSHLAKVRLAVYRNENNEAEYLVECGSLSEDVNQWNKEGLKIDIFPFSRKNNDAYSNIKSANFLPYVMAGLYAEEHGVEDCLVLNSENKIADASKANIFLIKNGEVFTPALNQGCVNGVMRRFLLEKLKEQNYRIHQHQISIEDLSNADEVFLTNAVYGIRWVKSFRDHQYKFGLTSKIYQSIISNLNKYPGEI
ncbi:MAG TPA: aminotransferase class IV [Flavisolibacter sp.]|nr:aminotransferase class IV [Flavisolibacter sp.]